MKITITPEKYYNNDAPVLTKKMLDWLFLTMWSTRMEYEVKKIETIDIRANSAYKGCSRIHFYIKVNGAYDYHKIFELGTKLYYQSPQIGNRFDKREFELSWGGKMKRREWVLYFVRAGVDCGEEGIRETERHEQQVIWRNKIDQIKKDKEYEKQEYQTYLRLKEKYDGING
jgi:hypothetical protein